jgi:uncharacterized membrane protein YhhN
MKNKWLTVFFIFSAINLLAVLTQQKTLIWCTKPALMPLLALWLFSAGTHIPARLKNGWLIGLVLSTAGDVFLMFEGKLFFLLGLASFLLAHVSYIVAVNTGLREHRGFLLKNPVWIPVIMLYPLTLLSWLWTGISADMRVPVTVYALVITTMAMSVLNLKNRIADGAFSTLMSGALLFVLSDSVLASRLFGHSFEGASFVVMATYIAGQYLLASGIERLFHRKSAEARG